MATAPVVGSMRVDGSTLAERRAKIEQYKLDDEFLEFPDYAEAEWSLEDIDSFYDSCGEWASQRK